MLIKCNLQTSPIKTKISLVFEQKHELAVFTFLRKRCSSSSVKPLLIEQYLKTLDLSYRLWQTWCSIDFRVSSWLHEREFAVSFTSFRNDLNSNPIFFFLSLTFLQLITDLTLIYRSKFQCDRRDLNPGFWLGRPESYQARLQSHMQFVDFYIFIVSYLSQMTSAHS